LRGGAYRATPGPTRAAPLTHHTAAHLLRGQDAALPPWLFWQKVNRLRRRTPACRAGACGRGFVCCPYSTAACASPFRHWWVPEHYTELLLGVRHHLYIPCQFTQYGSAILTFLRYRQPAHPSGLVVGPVKTYLFWRVRDAGTAPQPRTLTHYWRDLFSHSDHALLFGVTFSVLYSANLTCCGICHSILLKRVGGGIETDGLAGWAIPSHAATLPLLPRQNCWRYGLLARCLRISYAARLYRRTPILCGTVV